MSKGNPTVKCRVSVQVLAKIEDYVKRYNDKQMCREPIDVSSFIRMAISEKLAKAKRGGRKDVVAAESYSEEDDCNYTS